jgi:hypothetical protein
LGRSAIGHLFFDRLNDEQAVRAVCCCTSWLRNPFRAWTWMRSSELIPQPIEKKLIGGG